MKRIAQVGIIILVIGWFPFMWLAIFSASNKEWSIVAFGLGFILCAFGAMSFMLGSGNHFWDSQEKLQKEIEKYKEAKDKYKIAEQKMIKKVLEEKPSFVWPGDEEIEEIIMKTRVEFDLPPRDVHTGYIIRRVIENLRSKVEQK